MAKCSECGRPKLTWLKQVQRLAEQLQTYDDTAWGNEFAEGMNEAGDRLAALLEELK
jgi:hypothetical protein